MPSMNPNILGGEIIKLSSIHVKLRLIMDDNTLVIDIITLDNYSFFFPAKKTFDCLIIPVIMITTCKFDNLYM